MAAMSGYTKLFSSILASTIWREDADTRLVWITLLAMADKYGVAEASVPGLADFARVSVDGCRRALIKLSSPDPDSRTPDHDGRRIEAVDGGWRLLNHAKYRHKLSDAERREYKTKKQALYRQRALESRPADTPGPVDTVDNVDKSGHSWTGVDGVDTSKSKSRRRVQKTKREREPRGDCASALPRRLGR